MYLFSIEGESSLLNLAAEPSFLTLWACTPYGFMMKNCWAKQHSKCFGKISREHLISKGVFEQPNIFVKGYSWCRDIEKEVSIASLTAKILCQQHNSKLSRLDEEGINAVRIFEYLLPATARSVNSRPSRFIIDGHLFEKWLLKTAINISYKTDQHIGVGMAESIPGIPSAYLLAVVFGELNFTHNMGIYTLTSNYFYKFKAGSIFICPVQKDGEIGGFLFHIRGLNFFLSLFPGHHPQKLRELGLTSDDNLTDYLLDAALSYRLQEIIVNTQDQPPYHPSVLAKLLRWVN